VSCGNSFILNDKQDLWYVMLITSLTLLYYFLYFLVLRDVVCNIPLFLVCEHLTYLKNCTLWDMRIVCDCKVFTKITLVQFVSLIPEAIETCCASLRVAFMVVKQECCLEQAADLKIFHKIM
jgi:hypothetical protein